MKLRKQGLSIGLVAAGAILWLGADPARAQMAMSGSRVRSLGGYGASTISASYSSGSGGYLPYSGNSHGFIPYRGSSLGVMGSMAPARRSTTAIGGSTLFAGTPIGGASYAGGGMVMGSRSGPRSSAPASSAGGMDMGAAPPASSVGSRRSPYGPGFGYPFRMPPSLAGSGSMSMP